MTGFHVETFRDDATGLWGWQCFTCRVEDMPYPSMPDAEAAGDLHVASPDSLGRPSPKAS